MRPTLDPAKRELVAAAIDALPGMFYVVGVDGRLLVWNAGVESATGYSADEIAGMFATQFFAPEDVPTLAKALADAFRTGSAEADCSLLTKDGRRVPLLFSGKLVIFHSRPCVVGMSIDITKRKRTEEALRRSEALFRAITETAHDITAIVAPDGIIRYVSPSAERGLGRRAADLTGCNITEFIAPEDISRVRAAFVRLVNEGQFPEQLRFRVYAKTGTWRMLSATASNSIDTVLAGIVLNCRDITEQSEAEERVEWIARHDGLTRLPNRDLLRERLQSAIALAEASGKSGAVLFLDLDRFKAVNDSLGHVYGDRLLELVAVRLTSCIRENDTVARHGGDEFVIVLPSLRESDIVERTAERIHRAFVAPFQVDAHELHVTSSIGACLFPRDGHDVETLVRHADIAMYEAKRSGRNTTRFFSPEMNARVVRELSIENDLRRALRRREFLVHYQPVIDLRAGGISGFEALIRWQHPERGLVMPNDFIHIAEETGLIEPIGAWVLSDACRQLKRWHKAGFPRLSVAVNLSACQLRDGRMLETVDRVLRETGVDPTRLELELTESAIMERVDDGMRLTRELSARKIRLAVDDFGTGYSSLNYLKRFPIDTLKIDQSFVRDVTTDRDDAAIVDAILALGKALHINVVAEGVETVEQFDYLLAAGCDRIQGFLFSPGVDAAQATRMLKAREFADSIAARLHPDQTRPISFPQVVAKAK